MERMLESEEELIPIELSELLNNKMLFHYTKESTAFLRILKTMTLRFGLLENTNDPKEAIVPKHDLSLSSIGMTYIGQSSNIIKNNFLPFLGKDIEVPSDFQKRFGVLCFTQQKPEITNIFDYGFAKPRMWAQYGEMHSGICLIFDQQEFETEFKKLECYKYSGPINYNLGSDEFTPAQEIDINKISKNELETQSVNYCKDNIENFYFLKSQDWKEENEYRYLIEKDADSSINIDINNSLKGIVVSQFFPEELEPVISNEAEEKDIYFYRLEWINGIPKVIDLIKKQYVTNARNCWNSIKIILKNMFPDHPQGNGILSRRDIPYRSELITLYTKWGDIYKLNQMQAKELSSKYNEIRKKIQKLFKIHE